MPQHFWKSFCLQDGVSLGHGGIPGVGKCGCPALSCCTYLAGDARLNPAIRMPGSETDLPTEAWQQARRGFKAGPRQGLFEATS